MIDQKKIRVTGPKQEVEDLCREVQLADKENLATISPLTPAKEDLFVSRGMGQVELYECAISFVLNIASTALYDFVKNEIAKRRKKGVEEEPQKCNVDDKKVEQQN